MSDVMMQDLTPCVLLEAAEADIADAQIDVAQDYCDNKATKSLCKQPKEAEKWLLRAARNGSEDAAFSLGHLYELEIGGVDAARIAKALACYKLSLKRLEDAKDATDRQQYKSLTRIAKLGIERALKILGGKDPAGKCY